MGKRIDPEDVGVYESRRIQLLAIEGYGNLLGLSKASGVSSSVLYRLTKELRPLNTWNASKVCNECGVSLDWIMGLTDDRWNGAVEEPSYFHLNDIGAVRKVVCRRLRTAIFESGIPKHELAIQMDITPATINDHLRCQYNLRGGTLARYCYALNVSADWIAGRTNSPACAWIREAA